MAVLLSSVDNGVCTITLNRPAARNALSSELISELRRAIAGAESNDEVAVIVLTGADPAFCAGLDLKELGSGKGSLDVGATTSVPWSKPSKLLIGAINGVAVTGGLELALNCDFLVASETARFADTHARVGIMPGWGLSVLLPRRIGFARSVEMSMTGNYMHAHEALDRGLVNHVVGHDELLPFTQKLAEDAASSDQLAARTLLAHYRQVAAAQGEAAGLALELENAQRWHRDHFDKDELARRRQSVVDRGRQQNV